MTMIHEGLYRDVIKAKPRQNLVFARKIASVIRLLLPSKSKKKRVILLSSDEENSPMCDDDAKGSSEDLSTFDIGSDTCAMCEGLAKVSIYTFILI